MKRTIIPFLVVCFSSALHAATLTVTNTSDSGAGSLRQAIVDANANSNADDIVFAIPASDPNCNAATQVCTISPTTPLSPITAQLSIDGYTQAGASPNTLAVGTNAVLTVEIDGAGIGNGLTISASNCVIRGLVIGGWDVGILISNLSGRAAPEGVAAGVLNRIDGCFIGTRPDGVTGNGNFVGIRMSNGVQSNSVGGALPASRNLISGNSLSFAVDIRDAGTQNNGVINNLIGTTRTGNAALANGGGVLIQSGATNNQIGSDIITARNVISGNSTNVSVAGPGGEGNSIDGNLIGTNATGTAALSNTGGPGIDFVGAPSGVSIGAGTEGAGNIISGNSIGIVLTGDNHTIRRNYIGTDITGTTAVPNRNAGMDVRGSDGVTISENIISGNTAQGVVLNGNFGATDGNSILLNRIGVNINGAPLGNGLNGVLIGPQQASDNVIGASAKGIAAGNTIANNGAAGVQVGTGPNVTGNLISTNSIYDNNGLGIGMPIMNDACDGDSGPNLSQNFPLLTSAIVSKGVLITGTLNSTANTTFHIEFFANPSCDASGFGEGREPVESIFVMTGPDCIAEINAVISIDFAGQFISATATDPNNNTSGFSPCLQVPGGGTSVEFAPNSYTVDEGAGTVRLTVRRTGDTSLITIVSYSTADGSAMAGSDYEERGGTLTFKPGETSQTIDVPIIDDTMMEGDETFSARLFPADGGKRPSDVPDGGAPISTATITIVDNDAAPSPTPTPTPPSVQLGNISGRGLVQTNQKVGICGFIIQGGTGKRVIVRGIGPSLRNGNPPIAGALNDPMIELYNANAEVIGSNDSWRSAQQGEIQASGLAPSDDREAAIIATLQPGAYTAIVRGAGNSSGVALVEVYELQFDQGQLANVSVRGDVLTNENVLINGIILVGGTPRQILFRAIGPDLRNRNISGELQDPILEVYDVNGVILGSNDNWPMSPQAPQIIATGLQPNDPRESAVLLTLSAGNYTAIVRGVNGTTGVGVAEAYRLD